MDIVKLYNAKLEVGRFFSMTRYPSSWKTHLSIHYAALGGVDCLLLEVKGKVKLPSLLKVVRRLSADSGLPPLVTGRDFNAYQRERLSEENIAWAVSERNFHVPFLMMAASHRTLPQPSVKRLSPHAQRIFLNAVSGKWAQMSTTQVSKKLGRSLSSAVSYFKEVEAIAPDLIKQDGRTKYLAALDPEEVWDRTDEAMAYLSSPIKERIFIKTDIDVDHLLHRGFRYSGFSALAKETQTDYGSILTLACTQRDYDAQKRALSSSRIVDDPEDANMLIQIWNYSVEDGEGECVDPLSLWLSMRLPDKDGAVDVEKELLRPAAAVEADGPDRTPSVERAMSSAEVAAPADGLSGRVAAPATAAAVSENASGTRRGSAGVRHVALPEGGESLPAAAMGEVPIPQRPEADTARSSRSGGAGESADIPMRPHMPSWVRDGDPASGATTRFRPVSARNAEEPGPRRRRPAEDEREEASSSHSAGRGRGRGGRVLVDSPSLNERLY